MADSMDLVFELGKVVYKSWRSTINNIDASKSDSPELLRSLGGADQEQILLQRIGKFWNQQKKTDRPDGLVLVTSHRLVFLSKLKTLTTTTDFLSFPLEMIDGLEATRIWRVTPAIRFQAQEQAYIFTLLSSAEDMVRTIQEAKRELRLLLGYGV